MAVPAAQHVVYSGWLLKRGELNKSPRRRFFVCFANGRLAYYKKDIDDAPVGEIQLTQALSVANSIEKGALEYSIDVVMPSRVWILAAGSPGNRDGWLRALMPFVDSSLYRLVTQKEGFLQKQGHLRKNWKWRYFVLVPGYLAYFEDAADSERLKRIGGGSQELLILGLAASKGTLMLPMETTLHSESPGAAAGHPHCLRISTPKTKLLVECADAQEREVWIAAITECLRPATTLSLDPSAPGSPEPPIPASRQDVDDRMKAKAVEVAASRGSQRALAS